MTHHTLSAHRTPALDLLLRAQRFAASHGQPIPSREPGQGRHRRDERITVGRETATLPVIPAVVNPPESTLRPEPEWSEELPPEPMPLWQVVAILALAAAAIGVGSWLATLDSAVSAGGVLCAACLQRVRVNKQSGQLADHSVEKGSILRCWGSFRRPSHIRTRMRELTR